MRNCRSPVTTVFVHGLVSSSFGNMQFRNPHFLSPFARRHRSRSRPGFKLFRPQSAIRNPHFLSPFARRHRSRSRPGFKLFRQFRNPHSAIRISSRLSPVATALDLGLVSSSFGNFAIRNPQSAIRNPQSAFPPHFLSPFGRRHRSRSRLGFKLFRQFRNPQSAIRISSHPHRVCQRRPASKSCQAISPGIPKAISRTRRSSESASAISPEMPSRLPSRI
jgi:hypothetical protein